MNIIKKTYKKVDDKTKNIWDNGIQDLCQWQQDNHDTNNKYHCQKCKKKLSFLKMIVIAKAVNIGETYKIKCPKCEYINIITKGEN